MAIRHMGGLYETTVEGGRAWPPRLFFWLHLHIFIHPGGLYTLGDLSPSADNSVNGSSTANLTSPGRHVYKPSLLLYFIIWNISSLYKA